MTCRFFLILFTFISCTGEPQNCSPIFEKGVPLGVNKNHDLEEASGLIASSQPGYFWSHNDSGHPAQVFLLDDHARTIRAFNVPGAKNRDWEDIAWGPDPAGAGNYIYVGDIGDNQRHYPVKRIYRFKEPQPGDTLITGQVAVLPFRLPDEIHDTEALFCDPISQKFYVISKVQKRARLYELDNDFAGDTLTAREVARLPFMYVVAADISRDGSEILVKNYLYIYYWKRKDGESIAETLRREATTLCYDQEPQGEAVAWGLDGQAYFTLSENAKGQRARLYVYKRKTDQR
ncbi:MAG: PE-PGRS family protein [Bacteroidetes bacterium]|nr:PE-PGRS family protein [Bacteroidota bacterium]